LLAKTVDMTLTTILLRSAKWFKSVYLYFLSCKGIMKLSPRSLI